MDPPPPETREARSSHIIIAGTGRTGTTFLVQYLTELGLDTHVSRQGFGQMDANANAGLEDMPLVAAAETLPYVIKAPWIGECVDEILASPGIQIDAAILPVRDLVEAASSRIILELRALHQNAPWMAQQFGKTWENWAVTSGGAIFSLNPVDQARILAVSFHRLIQRLVDARIPMLFLGFPRFVEDGDYLFEQLRSILPETVTPQQALAAHQRIAQREKVRVGDELGSRTIRDKTFSVVPTALNYPHHDQVDRIALGREIARLTQARAHRETQYQETIADLHRRGAEATKQAEELAAELEAQRIHAAEATKQATGATQQAAEATQQAEELAAELEAQRIHAAEATKQATGATQQAAEATQQAAEATNQMKELAAELEAQRFRTAEAAKQAEQRAIELDAFRRSTSWRITAWLRWLSTHAAPYAGLARLRRDRGTRA